MVGPEADRTGSGADSQSSPTFVWLTHFLTFPIFAQHFKVSLDPCAPDEVAAPPLENRVVDLKGAVCGLRAAMLFCHSRPDSRLNIQTDRAKFDGDRERRYGRLGLPSEPSGNCENSFTSYDSVAPDASRSLPCASAHDIGTRSQKESFGAVALPGVIGCDAARRTRAVQ